MLCVHAYSESDNALLSYGRLKFSKMRVLLHGPEVGRSVVNIHTVKLLINAPGV